MMQDFYGVYHEISPPERLVNTEFFETFPDAGSVVTTVLSEEGGKIRLGVSAGGKPHLHEARRRRHPGKIAARQPRIEKAMQKIRIGPRQARIS